LGFGRILFLTSLEKQGNITNCKSLLCDCCWKSKCSKSFILYIHYYDKIWIL